MSAAGVLFACRGAGGWEVCLARRSCRPDTGRWTIPGGGLLPGETAWVGAWRETREEWFGHQSPEAVLVGQLHELPPDGPASRHVHDRGDWSFTTFLVAVADPFPPDCLTLDPAEFHPPAQWFPIAALSKMLDADLLKPNVWQAIESLGLAEGV